METNRNHNFCWTWGSGGIRTQGVQLVQTINHIFYATHKSQILPTCYESNVDCDTDMKGSDFKNKKKIVQHEKVYKIYVK